VTWFLGEMAPFDIESTGVDVESARVVTATVAQIVPGSETLVSSHLIAVDVDIPEAATAVHGITTEHARENGKPAAEVLEAVAAQLAEVMANGIPVVGMNLQYDFTLLDRELRRNGLATLDARLGRPIGPVVDVFVIDKALDKYRKGGRKLVDMCATYGARRYLHSDTWPELTVGLTLDPEGHGGGIHIRTTTDSAHLGVSLKPGLTAGFGIGAYSGEADTEEQVWARFHSGEDARRNMTLVIFTGGLPGWEPMLDDQLVIRHWNSNGACDERVIGFDTPAYWAEQEAAREAVESR
jgi:hypothetical protein